MNKFVPLHIISGYSFLQSGLTIKRIVKSIRENGYSGAGLADINGMYGFPEFSHALEEMNLPYILGVSFVIEGNNICLYVLNEDGYKNIIHLLSKSQQEELKLDYLKNNLEGVLGIIETKHGLFYDSFKDEIDEKYVKSLANLSMMFHHRLYLGIEVTSKEDVHYANKIRQFAADHSYECVAFPRIRYAKKEDAIIVRITNAIDRNDNLEVKKENGQEYFMSEVNYSKIYSALEIENTRKILELSSFKLNQKRGELLVYSQTDSKAELEKMAFDALRGKGLESPEYIERVKHELGIINEMGYADYFLLVQDYVNWAKNNGILVGPGRGSSAGSLVSYLLNIIEIDPLKYDLQFERFLNPNRKTMPDIDVDFMDTRRDDVIQYMRDKYGHERVANIVAFQTIQAKQALRDIGRVFKYPERHITLLSKALTNPKLTLGQSYKNIKGFKDLVDSDQYFKEFVSLAGKIEGLPRQAGQHAAGVVINNSALDSALPVTIDFNDNYITQFEAKYLEEEGFLKMDFLGLRNLTTIDYCLQLIKARHPKDVVDLNSLSFDDPDVYQLICQGHNIGLFQIETMAMKKAIKILQPRSFDDLVALLALNRPGPMQFIPNYAKRRDGKEKITYIAPELEKILQSTYGIIIYQEQINSIATEFAGFTKGEADMFRRAISKKDKESLNASKKQFIEGALKKGHSQKTAESLFEHIAKFADYGFNKSHSVVYAVITYKMAYLKVHYPLEFYAALLETGSSTGHKFSDYIAEMRQNGVKVLPPSINHSAKTFVIDKEALLFPLSAIKEVTDMTVSKIIADRETNGLYKDYFNFTSRMYEVGVSEAQIIKLIDAGALDELYPSRASMLLNLKAALQYAHLIHQEDGQLSIGIPMVATPLMNEAKDDPIENLEKEYDVLGIMLSNNPLSFKQEILKKNGVVSIKDIELKKQCAIAGIINNKKVINTKGNKQMAFIKIFDVDGDIEVTIFPETFEKSVSLLEKNNIILIKGHAENNKDELSFVAEDIKKLEE